MSDNSIRENILKRDICLRCCAYYGINEKSCHSMTPGCPVPPETRIAMELFNWTKEVKEAKGARNARNNVSSHQAKR